MRLGRVGRLAAVAGVFLLADPWLTVRASAQASGAQVVSPGEAVALPQGLSFNLPALADGRVNSYGVAGEVTGVGFGTATDIPGGPNYQAAPGDQLLMFGLQLSSYMVLANDTIDSTIDPTSSTTVKVTTGSQTINLPQVTVQSLTSPGGTTGDELATQYYALSVAPGTPAIMSVTCGGITQELNLRTGKRVGTSPQALYRDPTQPAVDISLSATKTLNLTARPGGAVTGQYGVATATLSYWAPHATTVAPRPDEAYLGVTFADTKLTRSADGDEVDADEPPGSAVHIVLPDGANIATTAIPNSSYSYLGGSTYYTLVPADTTAATVTLEPNQDPAAIDPNQAEQSNGQFNPTASFAMRPSAGCVSGSARIAATATGRGGRSVLLITSS